MIFEKDCRDKPPRDALRSARRHDGVCRGAAARASRIGQSRADQPDVSSSSRGFRNSFPSAMPFRLPASEDRCSPKSRASKRDTINVTPFIADHRIELGARVTAMSGQLTLSPHDSWLGRTLNALGHPIDDRRPLHPGDRAVPIQGSPPARDAAQPSRRGADDRRQSHRSLHADLRRPADRHFRRLRRRQIDAARHAEPGAVKRRDGAGARRRAKPRSARFSRRYAQRVADSRRRGRCDVGRKPDDAPLGAERRHVHRRVLTATRARMFC